uniref:Immunoglobulin superfamily, member 9a n=1 Tax=Amphiprion percula TaxID=161767 RepID=A0A3P8TC20_AMPPE
RGKVGGLVELECSFPPSGPAAASSASLHVVEWVRQGLDIPVLIKFGSYAPRVHPQYEGRVSLVRITTLRLEGLQLNDQGLYECRILLLDKPTDELRNGTWTVLSVTAPPIFTEAPPPVLEALVGSHLSLPCVANGNPTPNITWLKDGRLCCCSDKLSLSHGGIVVEMRGPPVIVVPPKSTALNMSQNALLRCQAVADPPNMTYVWQKGGENVHHIEALKSRVKIMVDGTLLISRVVPEDSGNYTCMPTNGLLTPPTASASLTVMHPAKALQVPQQTYLPTGMDGVISCPVAARPPLLRVDWTKDGEPLDLSLYPGWTMKPDGSLFMATVNDDAAGVYTCTPYNSYGSLGPSAPTNVILQDPPSFSVTPEKQYREEAGRTLRPVFIAYSIEPNGSLLLQPLLKDHQGAWECSASNRVASVKASTRVFVMGTSPHAATSLSVSPGVRQANISWEAGFDGGSAQTFSVWWVRIEDWFSVPVPPSSGSSLQVTGLSPATDYQFSILSQNKMGTGPFSDIATARTLDPVPRRSRLKPPTSLSAYQDPAGVILRWSPPEPPVTGFVLQSRVDQGEWFNLDEDIGANSSEIVVPCLHKDCVYELRLLSRRGELLSEPSPSVNVSTVETYPSTSRLPEFVPEPLLVGVLGGAGFMCLALVVLLGSACLISHKRDQRRKKKKDGKMPLTPETQKTSGSGSPDSVLKKSLLPASSHYPTSSSTTTTTTSSSLQTDCSSFSAENHHWRKQFASNYSRGRLAKTSLNSPPIELISRAPDGRFILPPYDSTLSVHSKKSGRYDHPARVRRSVSLHSEREDRKEIPFVLSVDLPPCTQDANSIIQTCGHRDSYVVGQKTGYDGFPDFNSLCSDSSLATIPHPITPTFPVLPHIRSGFGQPSVTASALVLQMEHERERGNLSRCLKLAQEREELERELRRFTLERTSMRGMKRPDSAKMEDESWEYKSSTLPHQYQQSREDRYCLSPSPFSASSVHWEAHPLEFPPTLIPSRTSLGVSSPATPTYFKSGNHHPFPFRSEEAGGSFSKDRLTPPHPSSKHSSSKVEVAFPEPTDGELCVEMSVDEPELEVCVMRPTKPMLHHRIASHVQHGRPLTQRGRHENMRRSTSFNSPASVDNIIRATESLQASKPELWRAASQGSKVWDPKQRSRSLDLRRQKQSDFLTPDAWIDSLSQENCSVASPRHGDSLFWKPHSSPSRKIAKSPANSPPATQAASHSPPARESLSPRSSPERPEPNPDVHSCYKPRREASPLPDAAKFPVTYHEGIEETGGYVQALREASICLPPGNQEALEVEAEGYEGVPESGGSYSSYASSGRGSMEATNGRLSMCHLSPTLTSSPETIEDIHGGAEDKQSLQMDPSQRYKDIMNEGNYGL